MDMIIVLSLFVIFFALLVTAKLAERCITGPATAKDASTKDADLLGRRVAYPRSRRALRRGGSEFGAAVITGFRWRWRQGRLKLLAELEEVSSGTRLYRSLSELGV